MISALRPLPFPLFERVVPLLLPTNREQGRASGEAGIQPEEMGSTSTNGSTSIHGTARLGPRRPRWLGHLRASGRGGYSAPAAARGQQQQATSGEEERCTTVKAPRCTGETEGARRTSGAVATELDGGVHGGHV